MKDDLTPEQVDRLAAVLQTFDRPDGVARARLLAALPAGGPPAQGSPQQARWRMLRRVSIRAALAAAVVVAAVGVWQAARPRSVFARAAAAMAEAKGFRCDMVFVEPRVGGGEDIKSSQSVTWTPTGGIRFESARRDDDRIVLILTPGRPGLSLSPQEKTYRVVPKDRDPLYSFALFTLLGEFRGPAGPPLETAEVDGHRAQRYELPWRQIDPGTDHIRARLRIWLDATTNLPVRADMLDVVKPGCPFSRFKQFRWGEQDPILFSTTPPAGYEKQTWGDFHGEQDLDHITFGLRTFAKYNNGRYPSVRYVYSDVQGEILRKLIGLGPEAQDWIDITRNSPFRDPKEEEFAFACSWLGSINSLQRSNPDCAYNGKTVTPQDAGKVLLRWQLHDGEYRVIYGDLHTETVAPARLREIEAK